MKYLLQILLLILFLSACCFVFWNNKEHFWFIPQGMSFERNDGLGEECLNLSQDECRRHAVCGYATLPNNVSYCTPGDWSGPANGEFVQQWKYGLDHENLSFVDASQPYWVNPNTSYNWEGRNTMSGRYTNEFHENIQSHIIDTNEILQDKNTMPHPAPDDNTLFSRHSFPPSGQHRRL